jgi:hypothetical protein
LLRRLAVALSLLALTLAVGFAMSLLLTLITLVASHLATIGLAVRVLRAGTPAFSAFTIARGLILSILVRVSHTASLVFGCMARNGACTQPLL